MYTDRHIPLAANGHIGSYSRKFSIILLHEFDNTIVTFKVPSTGPDSIIGVMNFSI